MLLNLSKRILSSGIILDGRTYPIKTDFQDIIAFLNKAKEKHPLKDFNDIYTERLPQDLKAGFNAVVRWIYPEKELPKINEPSNEIVMDYMLDSDMIYAAFMEKYHIDLFTQNLHLHWYKFCALLDGLKGTKLNDVISYRLYSPKKGDGAEYTKSMTKLKNMWSIETPLTEEEKEAIEKFEAQLKKGDNV